MTTGGEIILRGNIDRDNGRFVLDNVLRIAYLGYVLGGDENPFGKEPDIRIPPVVQIKGEFSWVAGEISDDKEQ